MFLLLIKSFLCIWQILHLIHFICDKSIQTPWELHYREQKVSDLMSPLLTSRLQAATLTSRWQTRKGKDVMCGQVWWPILRICALHLTHPSAHTAVNTHTHTAVSSEHTPGAVSSHLCCGARGAVGGLVPCSRVSPQSWYWGWRERCTFTPPTYNPCWTWDLWATSLSLHPLGHDCPTKSCVVNFEQASYLGLHCSC